MNAQRWHWIDPFALLTLFFLFPGSAYPRSEAEEPPGSWQLEEEIEHLGITLAYSLDKSEKELNVVTVFQRFNHTGRMSKDLSTRLEFEYGLTGRVLLGIDYSYVHVNPDNLPATSRSGDIEVEGKYMFISNRWLAASFGAAVGSRLRDDPEGEGRASVVELFLPLSHEFSNRVRSHLNLGMEWTDWSEAESFLQAAIECRPLGSGLKLQAALHFLFEESETAQTLLVGGFQFPFNGWSLGLGFPVGFSSGAPDWGVTFNVEFEFDDKE